MPRRWLNLVLVVSTAATLSACGALPRVQATTGPTAELNDRMQADEDEGNPRVFAVVAIDGVAVPNGLNKADRVGWGHGQGLLPYMLARTVEAKPRTYRLRGEFLARAPIERLVRQAKGNDPTVEGELIFNPKPGGVYRLNGALSPSGSAVWIEDFETGQVVSERVSVSR